VFPILALSFYSLSELLPFQGQSKRRGQIGNATLALWRCWKQENSKHFFIYFLVLNSWVILICELKVLSNGNTIVNVILSDNKMLIFPVCSSPGLHCLPHGCNWGPLTMRLFFIFYICYVVTASLANMSGKYTRCIFVSDLSVKIFIYE